MTVTPIRDAFLAAAGAAAGLLADPAVAEHWAAPSALPEFSVAGLAGHLSLQVRYVAAVLGEPDPGGPTSTLTEHYDGAAWIGAPVDDEANVSTRVSGEAAAAAGPDAVAVAVAILTDTLSSTVRDAGPDRRVLIPWTGRRLTLDDFLLTRMMEIVVHSDDLAVSVGIPTPVLPPAVTDPVLDLLTGIAVRRHGALPLLRALSRAERAPATIAAF